MKRKPFNEKILIPFAYYGGKASHLKNILPFVPKHDAYLEPFAGSLAVLLNKPVSKIEIVNDLDYLIFNFFKVLRDHKEDLLQKLEYTLYSKNEFQLAVSVTKDSSLWSKVDQIELARCTYCIITMAIQTSVRSSGSSSNFAMVYKIKAGTGRFLQHKVKIERDLSLISKRLRSVAIENKDAIDLLEKILSHDDAWRYFIYCDPPYIISSMKSNSTYRIDSSKEEWHEKFLCSIIDKKAKIMVSGYESDLYNDILAGWNKAHWHAQSRAGSNKKLTNRIECLWMNYNAKSGYLM